MAGRSPAASPSRHPRRADLCVLLGQGTGGGALAVMPADRDLRPAPWLSPLPPEGASAILYRETSQAPELAESQRVPPRPPRRRDRRPDRGRAPRCRRRAGGVLPPDVPVHPARARDPGPHGPRRAPAGPPRPLPPPRPELRRPGRRTAPGRHRRDLTACTLAGAVRHLRPGGVTDAVHPAARAYICQPRAAHWAGGDNAGDHVSP